MSLTCPGVGRTLSCSRMSRTPGARNSGLVVVPFLASSLIVVAVSLWLLSPRFSITGPALIDDWDVIREGGLAMHQLTDLSLNTTLYDAGRFRPGMWIAGWVQWHVLGGPKSMTGPNFWNLIRAWLFGAGLCGAVVAGVRPEARRRLGRGWLTAIAALPALLVLTTPGLIDNFARFVPQEPQLVGGMAAGLLLLLLALRLSINLTGRWRTVAVPAALIVGALVWAFGVFMKETSITFICFVPFLLIELRDRWSDEVRAGRIVLGFILVAFTLPFVYMVIGTEGAPQQHTLVYGTTIPSGIGAWVSRLITATKQQWSYFLLIDGGTVWRGLAEALPLLIAWQWIRERRPPWIVIGLAVLALAALTFQGIPLTFADRYLIPSCALIAVALAVIVAEAPLLARVMAVAAGTLLVLINLNTTHEVVSAYAAEGQAATRLVAVVSSLSPARCPVYLTHIDIERRASIPELVALDGPPKRPCVPGYQAVVVNMYDNPYLGRGDAYDVSNPAILDACGPPGWQQIERTTLAFIEGCRRLLGVVKGSNGTVFPVSEVLTKDRIVVPASPWDLRG